VSGGFTLKKVEVIFTQRTFSTKKKKIKKNDKEDERG
jgi:hypothetical protein